METDSVGFWENVPKTCVYINFKLLAISMVNILMINIRPLCHRESSVGAASFALAGLSAGLPATAAAQIDGSEGEGKLGL